MKARCGTGAELEPEEKAGKAPLGTGETARFRPFGKRGAVRSGAVCGFTGTPFAKPKMRPHLLRIRKNPALYRY